MQFMPLKVSFLLSPTQSYLAYHLLPKNFYLLLLCHAVSHETLFVLSVHITELNKMSFNASEASRSQNFLASIARKARYGVKSDLKKRRKTL